ncbi:MAG: D-glycerate dehydrogenase [Desulfarculaceae bacterium]|jgi:glyoxylate reductase
MFKVFITRLIPQEGIDLLKEHCLVEVNPHDRPLSREELLHKIKDRDGVIGLLTDKIDAGFFEAAPALKGYANFAVGFDNIDVPEAARRGIPVSNTPEVLTLATAEAAWALLFAAARRVAETDSIMRSGAWPGWGPLQFIGADVSGKTLGIVGAGRIGTAVALMSRGFDMRVLYCDEVRSSLLEKELKAEKAEFNRLLAESDFISVHVPLLPGTRHLFDADAFKAMKKSAFIINTSRGPVIKEDDLVQALKNGEIAGAGLDVYENEPAMAPGLAECQNAVLLPHIGSATQSSRAGMATVAATNLLAMLKGERAPNCLNPEIYD